ncbi:peptidase T [Thermodesulfobacteriota bacterium]
MKTAGIGIPSTIRSFLRKEAKDRFLRYVKISTSSSPESKTHPSSEGQITLAGLLKQELSELELKDVELDEYGYLYAVLPASPAAAGPPITFCSHLDTSPAENGKNVEPVIHENYDGGTILFEKNNDLKLSPEESPELKQFIGENIITSSGDTLLGSDDKAGIAEIMAALAAFKSYPELPHPELRVVFTPDEEIGRGADHIDMKRLGRYGYTVDGDIIGVMEDECFDAFEVSITLKGKNIHPGYAKGKMVNAGAIAARFAAAVPEYEAPEHTEKREGFYHLTNIEGTENQAVIKFIIRDFEREKNLKRIEYIKSLITVFELRYNGLSIELDMHEQYSNMKAELDKHPEVTELACLAIEQTGLEVIKKPIRGGTDGARLTFMGMPAPNLFTGGMMFHSKTEWVPEIALEKSAEVILNLCRLWAEENGRG